MYLEELVNSWYKFDTLGDSGSLLMIRYYSIPRGLLHPKAKLRQEIDLWINSYNKRFFAHWTFFLRKIIQFTFSIRKGMFYLWKQIPMQS